MTLLTHEELNAAVEIVGKNMQTLTKDVPTLKGIAEDSLASINAVARIPQSHQERITGLEDGN
jgi:hypothetical protein